MLFLLGKWKKFITGKASIIWLGILLNLNIIFSNGPYCQGLLLWLWVLGPKWQTTGKRPKQMKIDMLVDLSLRINPKFKRSYLILNNSFPRFSSVTPHRIFSKFPASHSSQILSSSSNESILIYRIYYGFKNEDGKSSRTAQYACHAPTHSQMYSATYNYICLIYFSKFSSIICISSDFGLIFRILWEPYSYKKWALSGNYVQNHGM